MNRPALGLCFLVSLVAACGGPSTGIEHGGAAAPPAITDETFHEAQRAYWRMDPEAPERIAWRDALVTYLATRSDAILERGEYDAVVEHLASLTELLRPEDVEAGRVPPAIAPLARWIVEHGAPRGDEGRVMGAQLLLASIGEGGDSHRAERERIARWGRDARGSIDNPIERYGSLIQVWEQQEQLAPAPEVLEVLARLYVEQRDALLGAFGPEGQGSATASRLDRHQLALAPLLVQRAPLDVAAVYLRHGDLERAIAHVGRMGDASGVEQRLISILERAQEQNAQGAEALGELAQGFARARPSISAAICRLGARRFEPDPRFPLCLARVAIEEDDAATATAWYAEAVRLAPDQREVYDEALGRLSEMMEEGLFEANVEEARSIARHALAMLDERGRRWPDRPAPVSRAEVLLSLGRAEMSGGNVDAARERLSESIAASESPDAHRELGLLLERVGQPREAATHYREALDLTPARGAEDTLVRAQLLEDLGDAFRLAGEDAQASRMYRQALEVWNQIGEAGNDPRRRAIIEVRRGVLLSRIGRDEEASRAFVRALEAGPSWRGPYAEILSHLVVSTPDVELAQDVLRRATYQLTLEREWRVYFALWVQAVAARTAAEPEGEVSSLLGELAGGEGWSGRLAAFGHEELDDEQLLAAASTPGERAEALFYVGTRELAGGDVAGARARFEQVIATNMVSFYEYTMAQELLAALPAAGPPEATPRRTEVAPPRAEVGQP